MQLIDKNRICAAFDRAAQEYDEIALFQHSVCEDLLNLLPSFVSNMPLPRFILDGGCGTGYGSFLLSQFWPDAHMTGCDLSFEMLRLAKGKNIHTVCADLEQLPFVHQQFDFIWSSLALQWCQTALVFRELYRVLQKEGLLLFATLGPGTLNELDFAFSAIDQHRHVRAFSSETQIKQALEIAGFKNIQLKSEKRTIYFPDLTSLLKSVRGIGANQVGQERRRTLMGKDAWKSVQKRYESLQNNHGLPATYHLVFGLAKR